MSYLFKTLKKQNQNYKGFFAVYMLLALIVSVSVVATTQLTGNISEVAHEGDTDTLLQFLGILTIVMAIRALVSAISALMLGRFAGKVGYRFRDNFAKYFLRKPFSAFEGTNSGESLSVFSNDLPDAVSLAAGVGFQMFADVLLLVVTFVYMLYINWGLTLIFFVAFPLLIVMQIFVSIPIQKTQVKRSEATASFIGVINDTFHNISTVTAYSLETTMEARFQESFKAVVSTTKKFILSMVPLILIGIAASMLPIFIIIAITGHRVIYGDMTIAEFIVFTGLAFEAGSWLTMLSQRQNNVQTHAGGAKRLIDTMSHEEEDLENGNALDTSKHSDIAISASNISFSYTQQGDDAAEQALVLDNISFEIKKGKRIAFVGGSGSGKSTILKLLLGLYKPSAGKFYLMGEDISGLSLNALRDFFSYVPQDCFLFPESIGANITGEKEISDMPRLENACKDAGILDFINALPDKFDSELSESAENISGGQKQRIALARAFYRNAPIILFDEATSALDPTTEAAILQSFDTLSSDKTVVMVAHRVSAIAFCDTIIVMDAGKAIAVGNHETLLQTCEVYRNLHNI